MSIDLSIPVEPHYNISDYILLAMVIFFLAVGLRTCWRVHKEGQEDRRKK